MPQSNTYDDTGSEAPGVIVLNPVGVIRNKLKEPFLVAGADGIKMRGCIDTVRRNIRKIREEVSHIIVNENLMDILVGIDKYSHLVVLYWGHKISEKSRLLTKVHPMGRKEFPEVGIFSTCSPARPNPVLMSVVRLCARKENVLEVTGLDAIDGSPVIDIKPYVKDFYPQQEVLIPEWMQRIVAEVRKDLL